MDGLARTDHTLFANDDIGAKPNAGNPDGVAREIDSVFRGRDVGSGSDRVFLDPRSFGGSTSTDDTTTTERKKRGRKAGTVTQKKRATSNLKDVVSNILQFVHGHLHGVLKSDIWQIPAEEADRVGAAFDKVAAEYAVEIHPKTAAWMELGGAMCAVYGTRILAYQAEKAFKKALNSGMSNGQPSFQGIR